MRIAMIQMDVAIGQPDVNIDRLLDKLLEAAQKSPKPDVIICPEMWNTGYALSDLDELADVDGMRTKNIISAFCRKHAVNVIAGSVAVKNTEQDCAYNQTYVFNRDGEVISQYAKIHLFQLMDEHHFLQPGESVSHCDLDGVDAGLMICYDIRFPELARKLALEGAKVLFVSAQWPNPRLQHWRSLLQARAIENQLYVVACNRVGESAGTSFFGHSMVIDPWGEVLVEGSELEQLIFAEIDINVVTQVRNKIPVFEDRRPTLY